MLSRSSRIRISGAGLPDVESRTVRGEEEGRRGRKVERCRFRASQSDESRTMLANIALDVS